jgi:predicted alpha/beta hydrolase
LRITTTQPGQLQSTTALRGTNTVWQNEGAISGQTTISVAPGVPGKFYRVLAQ